MVGVPRVVGGGIYTGWWVSLPTYPGIPPYMPPFFPVLPALGGLFWLHRSPPVLTAGFRYSVSDAGSRYSVSDAGSRLSLVTCGIPPVFSHMRDPAVTLVLAGSRSNSGSSGIPQCPKDHAGSRSVLRIMRDPAESQEQRDPAEPQEQRDPAQNLCAESLPEAPGGQEPRWLSDHLIVLTREAEGLCVERHRKRHTSGLPGSPETSHPG